MQQSIHELFDQLRLADALDIAIVAASLYVAMIWLKERASRSLGVVVVALISVFLLARWMDLYLTTLAFQYGSVGILLILVIIFQNDIRHGFERLAASRLFAHTSGVEPSKNVISTLAESIAHMARERIGALILLPNREPLDRHLRGGVDVDAEISLPLLLSIFHPKSPGHDGAVLIEQERIAKLGIHLPLSKRVDKVHDSGTRHAAALGLSECCDALVIVVSEERGVITLAENAELQVVKPSELADRLQNHFSKNSAATIANRSAHHWGTVFTAITLAALLWLTFAYHTDTIQRTFVIPIEYRNVPIGLEIGEPKPTLAELTLSGFEPAFNLLQPASVTVSLDLKNIAGGVQRLDWKTEGNLKNIPSELTVEQIDPSRVTVFLRKKAE